MKILVTGGAGFIGHNVVSRLEKMGHKCSIIDNMTTYGIIPQEEIDRLHKERRRHYVAPVECIDIGKDDKDVDWVIKHYTPDIIIHMAGFPRQDFINKNSRLAANVMVGGLVGLLESAKKHKVKRFIYISSSMVYGNFYEDVDENSPTSPKNQYSIFKLAGELLVKQSGLQYNIIRPSTVYGERDIKDRVVSKFFLSAINGIPLKVRGADEKFSFTYIGDVVDGIILAALDEDYYNEIYNIVNSESRTLLEAAKLIIQIVGKGEIVVENKGMFNHGLKMNKAKHDLGYNPKVNIEEGFLKLYDSIR